LFVIRDLAVLATTSTGLVDLNIKRVAALKEYFKKRSTQKRATPNNSKNDNKLKEL
jgi:hypothetical protein